MIGEVVAIGDELVSGQRLDTNSQWLSQRLAETGVAVSRHVTVGDDLEANVQALRQACQRADVVVATGGLGPTADDLTREALARLVGARLELRPEVLAHIEQVFARRGRPMPESNRRQALFPPGARVIPNPEGTAPGVHLEVALRAGARTEVFALPGVPGEMQRMWREYVAPRLTARSAGRVIAHRRIHCFGAGESEIEQRLGELTRRGQWPLVGITASGATITLRVTAEGRDRAECERRIEPVVETIRRRLGPLVFGQEDERLEDVVVRLLAERRATLAVAEWGAGGLVAHWLSRADAAGVVFRGGAVCASRADAQRLAAAVSPKAALAGAALAAALAEAVRGQWRTDWGLAAGPLPHPRRAADEAAPLWIAVAGEAGAPDVVERLAGGRPEVAAVRAAKQALDHLRLRLAAWDAPPE